MRLSVFFETILCGLFFLGSCVEKDTTPYCSKIDVIIEVPVSPAVTIETNIWKSITSNGSIRYVLCFDDYVLLEKERIKEPYIALYDRETEELICMESLENCVCTKTQMTYLDNIPWPQTTPSYSLVFYVRVYNDLLTYAD